MKILRITLCNLASLAGLHTVDFTRDPLRSAGLFSISGPTGSGKSTLLDALCLALYDDTPRLHQVGPRLAELANGDRQNDPRSLLRRGTGEGFAEVAFVGVDYQSYTARWTVRRGRRSADGALQSVDMVLFKGHVEPGGEGQIEEGGKKTAVLNAIESRIGLTFQQFTRAVLLAQNDFATFLKADDKERAEILQALTGTEKFEEISKSVYLRCQAEQKALDALRIQLAGLAAMDEGTRQAAELRHQTAVESLRTVEQRASSLQTSADWFAAHRKLEQDKAAAEKIWQDAVAANENAGLRRRALQLTEELLRDGRPLWDAERSANDAVTKLSKELLQSTGSFDALKIQRDERVRVQLYATSRLNSLTARHKDSQPLFQKARELDNTLRFRQSQFDQASDAHRLANESAQRAAAALKLKSDEQTALVQKQNVCLSKRSEVAAFAPFAPEASRWLDRLDSFIQACRDTKNARTEVDQVRARTEQLQTQVKSEQDSVAPLKTALSEVVEALAAAKLVESQFDANAIAEVRSRLDALHEVLRRLFNHLRDAESLRVRAKELAEKIQQNQDAQSLDATALERIRSTEIPQAELAINTAKTQLEITVAAVSDHAKRLRESLHDGHECPVCGSTSHPYRDHAPEEDVAAIKAAKKFIRDLEKNRDELMKQEARLQSSIDVRASQIVELQAEHTTVQAQMASTTFETPNDTAVQEICALPEEARKPACEQRLLRLNVELRSLVQREQKARDASLAVRETQSRKDQIDLQMSNVEQRLAAFAADLQKAQMSFELAEKTLQRATESQATIDESLVDVWQKLPESRDQFQQDAAAFRDRFDQGTRQFVEIEQGLLEVQKQLEQASAEIKWLSDAAVKANAQLEETTNGLRLATERRDEVQNARSQLFSGRAIDEVERELDDELKAARDTVETSTEQLNSIERQIAAAESQLKSVTESLEQARQSASAATSRRAEWLRAFTERHGASLNESELEAMLARDSAWIDSERSVLKQLEDAVAAARGEAHVRSGLLQEHVSRHSPDRAEAEILAELNEIRLLIGEAKSEESEALGVLQVDDQRRRDNVQLLERIRVQDARTDPWRKLSELLGSADGSKFRLIAQRTTLDVLLAYANQQLSQFASRYALERIPESLNLIIVDRDMGDECRSVHSLSGGESFLVSLALALGLASLTSNRLRIESLFIDEGFGSLDPETLNTAMSALMQLESQGRKVGVISHVTEMTDAIPVQIRVIKGRRGASRIVVPGCEDREPETQDVSGTSHRVHAAHSAAQLKPSADMIRELSQRMISILERESAAGKSKVSTKALREELQCDPATFRKAQTLAEDRVLLEGRSLLLKRRTEMQSENEQEHS